MKQIVLFMMLVYVPTIYTAQTLSSGKTNQSAKKEVISNGESKQYATNESLFEDNTIEIFVEVEAEEYYQKNVLKINISIGENYKSMIAEKKDFKLLGKVLTEAKEMQNIPDLLNYFSSKGFKIAHYSTFLMNDVILNKIILSQRFTKQL